MKIAQIAPLYEAVPPRLYGGTERIVAFLTDALVSLGHEVTLFASGDGRTSARLVPARSQALRLDPNPLKSDLAAHMAMLAEARARASEFDILHFHTELIHFPFFEEMPERTVTTLHGRLDLDDLAGVYRNWPEFPLVSISDRQRQPMPWANWTATVHHGLPEDHFSFSPKPNGGYLAFLGRISPEKRPERAIKIALELGIPLKIAAKVDPADEAFFKDCIKPYLSNPLIEFIGEIGEAEKSDFLGNALALLFLIDWPEPFGLVMIEAMACGTPVIAWNCGSVPEVIDDGVTGFIVDSEAAAFQAVRLAERLSRLRIRRVFEQRHVATLMAKKYLDIYARGIGRMSIQEPLRETA